MAQKSTKKRVTFTFSNPDAREVFLAGSFNAWDPSAKPFKKDTKGLWKAIVMLPQGSHEYRFIVDGQWVDDPDAPERQFNEFGSHNAVINV